jgi:hypothetical protein
MLSLPCLALRLSSLLQHLYSTCLKTRTSCRLCRLIYTSLLALLSLLLCQHTQLEESVFNPSELTVKSARARLCELDVAGLESVLQAEIDGKHRSSLIADIGRAIDAIKTAEASEATEVTVEPAKVEGPSIEASVRYYTQNEYGQMNRATKKSLVRTPLGYKKRA